MTTSSPSITVSPSLKALAKDLSKEPPRSPRETIGGFVLAARMLDKCRASLNGTAGEYHFDCPLDNYLLEFTGISAREFEAFVATGADDQAVDQWIREHAKQKTPEEIAPWNNELRDKSLKDLPVKLQVYMESYIPQFVPKGKVVYRWFDVYDYEEGRL
ncbi:MAG: DUF5069 domain-containing protein [Cyanobacteria bacterium]|nr:DUF5069 domain-containing protein [Cyanobacteriota bacterium]